MKFLKTVFNTLLGVTLGVIGSSVGSLFSSTAPHYDKDELLKYLTESSAQIANADTPPITGDPNYSCGPSDGPGCTGGPGASCNDAEGCGFASGGVSGAY